MSTRLSRRLFLRASGVAIALPFLESLLPQSARGDSHDPTKRFVSLFFPNGTTRREDWALGGSGTDYTMGSAHASLEPFRSKLSMLRNLDGDYGGAPDHSRGTASFLTGAPIGGMTNPEVDISIDQAIANELDPATALRSFHLGPTPYPGGPPSDTGWPSGYNTYISWSSRSSPNPPLESARVAFDRIYVPAGEDPAQAQKRLRLRQSVLDHTLDQIDAIAPRLGAEDSQKLEQYLTAVREVESNLQGPSLDPGCGDDVDVPVDGLAFAQHTPAILEVIALALRCDATRIVTYSMDYGFGNKNFGFLGQGNFNHHTLSHSGTEPATIAAHQAIVRWYMSQIALFLGLLDDIDEGGMTLLDNSVVFVGSDVGDPWPHSHQDLPVIVAGGGGGALSPGRLIDASGASYGSVLLALADAMDAPLGVFAGATSPFSGL